MAKTKGSGLASKRGKRNTSTISEHLDWSSASDIAQTLGVSNDTAQRYYDAIQDFTFVSYRAIKMAQTVGIENTRLGDEQKRDITQKAEDLEAFISASPKWAGGNTYRGVSLDYDAYDSLTKVGSTVDLNLGSASWSTGLEVSEDYAGQSHSQRNPRMVVFVNDTKTQNGTSVMNLSKSGKVEKEVLMSKDTRYKIKGVDKHDTYRGVTYVYVEEA